MVTSQTVKKADVFNRSVLGDGGFVISVILSVLPLIIRITATNILRERRSV